jgi:hypothetical protein
MRHKELANLLEELLSLVAGTAIEDSPHIIHDHLCLLFACASHPNNYRIRVGKDP